MANVEDRLDDLGIGILASPYVAQAVGGLAAKSPRLAPIARAAQGYEHAFHATPYGELAGLALVAPGVTKRLAPHLQKEAFYLGVKQAKQQLSVDGYTREEAAQLFPRAEGPQLEEAKDGLNAELEHRGITQGSDVLTRHIVQDHLKEDPRYYAKLLRAGL